MMGDAVRISLYALTVIGGTQSDFFFWQAIWRGCCSSVLLTTLCPVSKEQLSMTSIVREDMKTQSMDQEELIHRAEAI